MNFLVTRCSRQQEFYKICMLLGREDSRTSRKGSCSRSRSAKEEGARLPPRAGSWTPSTRGRCAHQTQLAASPLRPPGSLLARAGLPGARRGCGSRGRLPSTSTHCSVSGLRSPSLSNKLPGQRIQWGDAICPAPGWPTGAQPPSGHGEGLRKGPEPRGWPAGRRGLRRPEPHRNMPGGAASRRCNGAAGPPPSHTKA